MNIGGVINCRLSVLIALCCRLLCHEYSTHNCYARQTAEITIFNQCIGWFKKNARNYANICRSLSSNSNTFKQTQQRFNKWWNLHISKLSIERETQQQKAEQKTFHITTKKQIYIYILIGASRFSCKLLTNRNSKLIYDFC